MVEILPEYQCLTSVPGIGKVFAAGIIAEIGQIEHFKDHPQVAKYAGLNWKETQSGTTSSQNTSLSFFRKYTKNLTTLYLTYYH